MPPPTSSDFQAWKSAVHYNEECVYLPDGVQDIVWFSAGSDGKNYPTTKRSLQDYNTVALYSSPPKNPPTRTYFALIGELSSRGFHFDADAHCGLGLPGTPRQGQGSAYLDDLDPRNPKSEYKRGWNNLADLASAPLGPNKLLCQTRGLFAVHNGKPSIHLSHNFFRRKPLEGQPPAADDIDLELQDDPTFHIDHWPATDPGARTVIGNMSSDWDAVPLRAFDWDRTVVEPKNYRRRLENATVWVEFFVDYVVEDRHELFEAVVRRIRILESPGCEFPHKLPVLTEEDVGGPPVDNETVLLVDMV